MERKPNENEEKFHSTNYIYTSVCVCVYIYISVCIKPIGPIAPNWAPRPILHILVQVDWEPGPTEIVPNWAPHLLRPALSVCVCVYARVCVCVSISLLMTLLTFSSTPVHRIGGSTVQIVGVAAGEEQVT